MKLATLALCAFIALPAYLPSAHASEYAQTVRLGSCVIKPGTSVLKLVECAGQPISKETSGINPGSGKLEDVWLYKSNGRTVIIHIASDVVTKVEVKAE